MKPEEIRHGTDAQVIRPDGKALELITEVLAQNRMVLEANRHLQDVLEAPPVVFTEKRFQCSTCGDSFIEQDMLTEHRAREHAKRPGAVELMTRAEHALARIERDGFVDILRGDLRQFVNEQKT